MINKKWIPLIALGAILLVALLMLGVGFFTGDESDVGPDQQPTQTSNP